MRYLLVLSLLAVTTPALAQQKPAAAPATATPAPPPAGDAAAPPDNAPKVKIERTASGQKIVRILSDIVVEGRIQKPNAFYVLQRSNIDYDWESLKQDFLPKILQATTKHPF